MGCFPQKCVSPLGHPPSIFNETHRLDEKKIKNGAKEANGGPKGTKREPTGAKREPQIVNKSNKKSSLN